MDPRNILLPTSADFALGLRIALMPDGCATPAAADDPGIGISITTSAGGKVIVQLPRASQTRRVAGPIHAGAGLIDGAAGLLVPGTASPDAIALAPVTEAQAEISVLPLPPGSALPRSATDAPPKSIPARRSHSSHPPAAAGPARKETMAEHFANPVATVFRRRSDLVAAGVQPDAALTRVFSDPPLQAAYAAVVRANPKAVATGIHTEVDRLAVEKMQAGMSRANAIFDVWRKDPDLQSRFNAAKSGSTRRASIAAAAPATVSPADALRSKRDYEAEIERRISPLKARGISHADAVCRVFKADSALHQAYLEAANAGRTIPR